MMGTGVVKQAGKYVTEPLQSGIIGKKVDHYVFVGDYY
jgi:hypothetical protein